MAGHDGSHVLHSEVALQGRLGQIPQRREDAHDQGEARGPRPGHRTDLGHERDRHAERHHRRGGQALPGLLRADGGGQRAAPVEAADEEGHHVVQEGERDDREHQAPPRVRLGQDHQDVAGQERDVGHTEHGGPDVPKRPGPCLRGRHHVPQEREHQPQGQNEQHPLLASEIGRGQRQPTEHDAERGGRLVSAASHRVVQLGLSYQNHRARQDGEQRPGDGEEQEGQPGQDHAGDHGHGEIPARHPGTLGRLRPEGTSGGVLPGRSHEALRLADLHGPWSGGFAHVAQKIVLHPTRRVGKFARHPVGGCLHLRQRGLVGRGWLRGGSGRRLGGCLRRFLGRALRAPARDPGADQLFAIVVDLLLGGLGRLCLPGAGLARRLREVGILRRGLAEIVHGQFARFVTPWRLRGLGGQLWFGGGALGRLRLARHPGSPSLPQARHRLESLLPLLVGRVSVAEQRLRRRGLLLRLAERELVRLLGLVLAEHVAQARPVRAAHLTGPPGHWTCLAPDRSRSGSGRFGLVGFGAFGLGGFGAAGLGRPGRAGLLRRSVLGLAVGRGGRRRCPLVLGG